MGREEFFQNFLSSVKTSDLKRASSAKSYAKTAKSFRLMETIREADLAEFLETIDVNMQERCLKEIDLKLFLLDECDKGTQRTSLSIWQELRRLRWKMSQLRRRGWEPINCRQELQDELDLVTSILCSSGF